MADKVTPIDGGKKDEGGALSAESQKQIAAFAGRIKTLLADRDAVNEDIREVFNEAGDAGFDKKILRKAVAVLRRDPDQVKAEQDMIDMYLHAVQPDLFHDAA